MIDPFEPTVDLLVKLGSIAVHAEEVLSSEGHVYDKLELDLLLSDPEVVRWLQTMDRLALLPMKRS